ncbi:MAG TPA: lysine--tRNA ligase [Actinomycetota bacterium]|jgi:lysyl-tRNA synthetase class 2
MTEEERGRLQQALSARRDKLERLRANGIEPYALKFDGPIQPLAEIAEKFAGLDPGAETGDRTRVAGRIVLLRRQGKLSFATLRDRTGDLQLFLTEAAMGSGYRLVDELDLGDIVGADGEIVKTRRGEVSVRVETLTLLTKAVRPMPEKWHGLRDPDLQQRHRELHLATDPSARFLAEARAKTLRALRGYLDANGFLEVETPVLQSIAGGAMARPFVTRHRVLDVDLYLRISLELYLKRLLVGGLERVYEIGHNFRNEGIDRTHNPEFTMLEVYQAYGDYFSMMDLTQDLVRESAMAVRGSTVVPFKGRELDLGGEWKRITVLGSVSEAIGDEVTLDRPDLGSLADGHGVHVDPRWGPGKIALELYEKLVEPTLFEPTFVMDFPREVSPLARPHRAQPGLTEHVDPVIGGVELGTAYSELTDPVEQRAKFDLQQQQRAAGDEETHPYDEEFIEALEQGMPPAGGLGVGIDRLLMVLTDTASIRDLILFPHHRPTEGRPEKA